MLLFLLLRLLGERDLFTFSPSGENKGSAASSCSGQCSPALHINDSNPLHSKNRTHRNGVSCFWRSERDLNPRAAFDRLLP